MGAGMGGGVSNTSYNNVTTYHRDETGRRPRRAPRVPPSSSRRSRAAGWPSFPSAACCSTTRRPSARESRNGGWSSPRSPVREQPANATAFRLGTYFWGRCTAPCPKWKNKINKNIFIFLLSDNWWTVRRLPICAQFLLHPALFFKPSWNTVLFLKTITPFWNLTFVRDKFPV